MRWSTFHIKPPRALFLFAEYVKKYATEEAIREQLKQATRGLDGNGDAAAEHESDTESSMSDYSEDEVGDMEL